MRPAVAIRSSIALAAALLAAGAAFAANAANTISAAPAPASAVAPPSGLLSDACPAQLPVSQTISGPVAGWTPLNQQGSYPFVRVAFYAGPPADGPLIVPSVEYKGQAGLHDRWDLPARAGGHWMTCAYANTTATVTRKLADDVDFCQADYDGRFLTLVVRHWACGVKRTMPGSASARPPGKTVKAGAKPATRRSD